MRREHGPETAAQHRAARAEEAQPAEVARLDRLGLHEPVAGEEAEVRAGHAAERDLVGIAVRERAAERAHPGAPGREAGRRQRAPLDRLEARGEGHAEGRAEARPHQARAGEVARALAAPGPREHEPFGGAEQAAERRRARDLAEPQPRGQQRPRREPSARPAQHQAHGAAALDPVGDERRAPGQRGADGAAEPDVVASSGVSFTAGLASAASPAAPRPPAASAPTRSRWVTSS